MSDMKRFLTFFAVFLIVICSAGFAAAQPEEITIMVNEDATANITHKIDFRGIMLVTGVAQLKTLCENIWNSEYSVENGSISFMPGQEVVEISYSADCIISKNMEKWNIGFDTHGEVEKVVIYLPRNSSITEFSPLASIRFEDPHMVISWEERNLTDSGVSVEYKRDYSGQDYSIFVFLVLVVLVVVVGFFYWKKKGLKVRKAEKKIFKGLSEGERKVIEIIEREDGISQKLLQERAKLPKATLSRLLHNLKEKGFIDVVQSGYTNKIYLSEEAKK
jgi:uncharacterized membrane protein